MKGKQPYWPGTLWRYYGRPALKRARITKQVTYHVSTYVWNAPERQWRKCQGGSGTIAAFQPEGYNGRVYAGRKSPEASGPKQTGQNGYGQGESRGGKSFGVTGPNWTMIQKPTFLASSLECWRPRRDLNPCYRRERRTLTCILNSLESTGGTVRHENARQVKRFVYHVVYHWSGAKSAKVKGLNQASGDPFRVMNSSYSIASGFHCNKVRDAPLVAKRLKGSIQARS
jgi:hypothetical protein